MNAGVSWNGSVRGDGILGPKCVREGPTDAGRGLRPTLADLFDRPPPSRWHQERRAGIHRLRPVPAGLAEARRFGEWWTEWDCWMRLHRWDWFVTLTFARDVTKEQAERAVARWFRYVLRRHPHAAAVTGIEIGPTGGRLHVHALVYLDGERYRLPALAGLWHLGHLRDCLHVGHPCPWPYGLAHVEPYRPFRHAGRGAAAYTVKGLVGVGLHGRRMPPAYEPRRVRFAPGEGGWGHSARGDDTTGSRCQEGPSKRHR